MITKGNDLLGTLIHDVAYLLRHRIDDRLRPYNLTRVKWLALGIIEKDGPLSQKDLAETLELGTASVGRLVDRLVQRGFVIREQDAADRRSYKLTITPSATQLITELSGLKDELGEETLQVLTEDEISTLKSGLSKLKKKLQTGSAAIGLGAYFAVEKTWRSASALTEFTLPV